VLSKTSWVRRAARTVLEKRDPEFAIVTP
jgi:hypothetical protein